MSSSHESSTTSRAQVTIVIPTINRPLACAAALGSALGQRGVEAHILVSENCSDDTHREDYDRLFGGLPGCVCVIRREQRLAVEDHFRWLVEQVGTRFVVLLADDDLLAPDFLERALPLAERIGAGAVFGPYIQGGTRGGGRRCSFDYSQRRVAWRALAFILHRDDCWIYGLFRTELLRSAFAELVPLRLLGRRTLTRIAYAPLFACLLQAPYGHVGGPPVWSSAIDSVKSESYLSGNNIRKLTELLLGEWTLALRFIRIAWQRQGAWFAAAMLLPVLLMGLAHDLHFLLLAVRRTFAALWRRGGRGVWRDVPRS